MNPKTSRRKLRLFYHLKKLEEGEGDFVRRAHKLSAIGVMSYSMVPEVKNNDYILKNCLIA